MRKKLIGVLLVAALLTGCQNSSDVLLSFSDSKKSSDINISSVTRSQEDFFAKDLTIITDEFNHMNNESITATSAFIVNDTDREVLYANNVYESLYPASLTKIVTAYVVLSQGNLTDMVTVSYNASHITESGAKLCGLKEGDKVSLETLLYSFLIYSGNDAGIAIAEHIGGTEENFAKMMNESMKSLGGVHSNFVNSHGLHDDNHYTTAYDLYLMFHELLQYDLFVSIINSDSYVANYVDANGNAKEKTFLTTNRYLNGKTNTPEGLTVIGGKTGTTSKAGNCLILYSKDTQDKNYISIVMQAQDGDSLFSQMTNLLEIIPQ